MPTFTRTALPVFLFYMPGFSEEPDDTRPWRSKPWQVLRTQAPELMPAEGWYDEKEQAVMDRVKIECKQAGVGLAMDYFWDHSKGAAVGDHALKNFMASKVTGVKFFLAIDTENSEVPVTCIEDWMLMFYQIGTIIQHPDYALNENGEPIVMFIKTPHVHEVITAATGMFGAEPEPLPGEPDLRRAQAHKKLLQMARESAGQDIYFIAGIAADEHWVWQAGISGYGGQSFYNMQNTLFTDPPGPMPTDWEQLVANYRAAWLWLDSKLTIDMWPAFSLGWDNQYMENGKKIARPTPDQFEAHFESACRFAKSRFKVKGLLGDAYNEHYEGSVGEPSKRWGRSFLYRIKKVVQRIFGA